MTYFRVPFFQLSNIPFQLSYAFLSQSIMLTPTMLSTHLSPSQYEFKASSTIKSKFHRHLINKSSMLFLFDKLSMVFLFDKLSTVFLFDKSINGIPF